MEIQHQHINSQTQKSKEEFIKTNVKHCKKFDLKISEPDINLPIMYWLPKAHKTPKLNKINSKKKNKSTSTFDFTTLYTTIPHNLLIKVLYEVINYVFKSKTRSLTSFLKTSVYWTSKVCRKRYFTRQTLFDIISSLITKCYFTIGNLVFKQDISFPMSIGQAPYLTNLFLCFFESKYFQKLLSKGSLRGSLIPWDIKVHR